MVKENKIGRFIISNTLLRDPTAEESIIKILSGMIIIRAEQRWDIDGIEYIALSDHFASLPKGHQAIDYKFIIDNGDVVCELL